MHPHSHTLCGRWHEMQSRHCLSAGPHARQQACCCRRRRCAPTNQQKKTASHNNNTKISACPSVARPLRHGAADRHIETRGLPAYLRLWLCARKTAAQEGIRNWPRTMREHSPHRFEKQCARARTNNNIVWSLFQSAIARRGAFVMCCIPWQPRLHRYRLCRRESTIIIITIIMRAHVMRRMSPSTRTHA